MTNRLYVVAGEDPTLSDVVARLGADASVRVLESANDALWEVRTDPPETLLADVHLDGMSGMDLAEILPNFEVHTQVVLWSKTIDAALREQAESIGVFRFVDGSSGPDGLLTALREALVAGHAASLVVPAEPEPEPEPEPAPEAAPRRVGRRDVSPAPEPRARGEQKPPEETPGRVVLPSISERAKAAAERSEPTPTPGRVVLPPVSERGKLPARNETPKPARVTLPPLSERGKTPAAKEEPAPATPARSPESHLTRRSSGTLVVTTDNINPIRTVMSQLSQDLGAQSIMLTDRAGMVLVEIGSTAGLPMMIVLPLLSTSFSTAGEVARQLHDDEAMALYIHEGLNTDLYCFDVAQRYLLVLVFNKKIASSKIGAVWVNAKRSIRELRDLLGKD